MTNLTILGGGDEIGASSYLLSYNSIGILIDAGIRLHSDRILPAYSKMFEKVENWKKICAVVVTHSHLDHIGALPKIIQENKDIPIYVPNGTKKIIEIQLNGNFRTNEEETMLDLQYSQEIINQTLEKIIEISFYQMRKIPKTNIYFEYWHAGHIIGSASIFVKTPIETILFTGDICKKSRKSVPNLNYLPVPIDYLICESTYLYHHHNSENRNEFEEIYPLIEKTFQNNGNVLIPSFAIGKAQEIVSYLAKYFDQSKKSHLIYIDGLVSKITQYYKNYYRELYLDENERNIVIPVTMKNDLEEYRKFFKENKGFVVVASSGMLNPGSRSSTWADIFVEDPNSSIIFSGYLDEESPGAKVFNTYRKNREMAVYNEKKILCEIQKYYLPTHISITDLIQLISEIAPKQVFLVHGKPSDKDSHFLSEEIVKNNKKPLKIINTKNNQIYELGEVDGKEN